MKILFCNIAYMLHYEGKTVRDIPQGAGSWVKRNQDAHEKWNFLNYNGYCYGFVMNKGNEFHIERIEGVSKKEDFVEGVTVVWCAPKSKDETVIVGWYENATIFREFQDSICTPITGLERSYFTCAKAEDCYLLPENLRIFTIERASEVGQGKGFGQQNYWYAESAYARNEIIHQVSDFLQKNKKYRINRTSKDFIAPDNLKAPLSIEEAELAETYYDDNNYTSFLPLGYRKFETTGEADDAFYIAVALRELFQFEHALEWFRKVIEIEGEAWDTNSQLPYLLRQCERYGESIAEAQKLFKYEQSKQSNIREEIYSIIADDYYHMGRVHDGIEWLDRILNESSDDLLIQHTKKTRDAWIQHK